MLNNVAGSYNPFIPSLDYADPNQFEEEFDAQEDDHEAESAVDDRKGFIGRRGSQKAAKKRAEHPKNHHQAIPGRRSDGATKAQ